MTKYYVLMSKKENVATIYFNFQKSVLRVCTHIQIAPSKWQTVNKSITAWNKYAKSEEGKPIVDERINELCEKYDYNFPVNIRSSNQRYPAASHEKNCGVMPFPPGKTRYGAYGS